MDSGLVRERTVTAERDLLVIDYHKMRKTVVYVMGFMKGMLTSTASATKFSISRSIGRLYLDLTYSGLAA